MDIISALFIDSLDTRVLPGPATRIDLTGIQFSATAPSTFPLTWAPHLSVIVRAPEGDSGSGILEVVYRRGDEQIARNVQPLQVEPGKFFQALVRGEIDFDGPGTIEAHCRIDQGPVIAVPYTMLPPVDEPASSG